MRILFLTKDRSQTPGVQLHYWLEEELSKLTDCKWAGVGYPDFKFEPVDDTVYRLYGNDPPDWVLMDPWEKDVGILKGRKRKLVWKYFVLPKIRDYKVVIHNDVLYGNKVLKVGTNGLIDAINNSDVDAVLMRYSRNPGQERGHYDRVLTAKVMLCPAHVNHHMVRPFGEEKVYDVSFVGSANRKYPLRGVIFRDLPEFAKENNLKYFLHKKSKWIVRRASTIPQLIRKGDIAGERYFRILSASKVSVIGCSSYRYFVQKFPEIMGCGTLAVSSPPMDCDLLHLKPDHNFVEINKDNWKEKILYYVEHDEEREQIAKRGLETIRKYHTSEVRARQVYEFLEENR